MDPSCPPVVSGTWNSGMLAKIRAVIERTTKLEEKKEVSDH
jgi:hypothetical protein